MCSPWYNWYRLSGHKTPSYLLTCQETAQTSCACSEGKDTVLTECWRAYDLFGATAMKATCTHRCHFEFWDWIMSSTCNLQQGTADAEIKAPSVENPELTNVLPQKPGVGQNIATHASPTARKFFLVMLTDPVKGVWGCLESQGCHLIPLSYLLSCFSA